MCSDILISLHPRHCDNLVSGWKTVELRRRKIAVQPGTRVWIYSTHPRARIEACAIVEGVFSGSHNELWNAFGDKVAVSRCEFDHYFAGTADAHAIVLREVGCFIRELLLTFSLSSTTCDSAWVSRGFSVIKHV